MKNVPKTIGYASGQNGRATSIILTLIGCLLVLAMHGLHIDDKQWLDGIFIGVLCFAALFVANQAYVWIWPTSSVAIMRRVGAMSIFVFLLVLGVNYTLKEVPILPTLPINLFLGWIGWVYGDLLRKRYAALEAAEAERAESYHRGW